MKPTLTFQYAFGPPVVLVLWEREAVEKGLPLKATVETDKSLVRRWWLTGTCVRKSVKSKFVCLLVRTSVLFSLPTAGCAKSKLLGCAELPWFSLLHSQ